MQLFHASHGPIVFTWLKPNVSVPPYASDSQQVIKKKKKNATTSQPCK